MLVLLLLLGIAAGKSESDACLGEFALCPTSGVCSLFADDCAGPCTAGQYACPLGGCVDSAADYVKCPNLKGTWLDWTLSADARTAAFVAAANLTELISQMTNQAPELRRLGLPGFQWLNDDEHGVKQRHATSFPSGNTLGGSWDRDLLARVGRAVSVEARGLFNGFVNAGDRGFNKNGIGITLYAPNLNLVRDPRWGRAQEVVGEDPAHTSALTAAFVNAVQEAGEGGYARAAACCKHFLAYDLESDPIDRFHFDARVNGRDLWETYLPAFRACVREARGQHVMCSYNAVNGVPACANNATMNGILRDLWGFAGFVVSDYDAWAQIKDTHQYCDSYECAAAAGLTAGMDQEGGGDVAVQAIPAAIDQGLLSRADVERAVRRLFRVRIGLGVMDPPSLVGWNALTNGSASVESAAHIALAREAAQRGTVLLANANATLPLPKTLGALAVVGPHAAQDLVLLGNYASPQGPDAGITSILEGLYSATGTPVQQQCGYDPDVDYFQPGQAGVPAATAGDCCAMCSFDAACKFWTYYQAHCYMKASDAGRQSSPGRISGAAVTLPAGPIRHAPGCADVACADTAGFDAAVAAATGADAVVVTVGLDQTREYETHDRSSVSLPGNQAELVRRVAAVCDRVVVVVVRGGTLALGDVLDVAGAVVDVGYPGMRGGDALADVLFGDVSPAGRVAVTYYASDAELPAPGAMSPYPNATGPGNKGATYRFYNGRPDFAFGHGLSYTTFVYSDLRLNATALGPCDTLQATVSVANTGSVDSDEVVQMYIRQPTASATVPSVRLVDFARVHIPAGLTIDVTLSLTADLRVVVHETADPYNPAVVAEKGLIDVFVGGGQPGFAAQVLSASLPVTASAPMSSCDPGSVPNVPADWAL